MAKSKRLTLRLDNELDSAIKQACENGKSDKTRVVINVLRKGLGLDTAATTTVPSNNNTTSTQTINAANAPIQKVRLVINRDAVQPIGAGGPKLATTTAITIPHRSHPSIKLIREIEYADGSIRYIDTEGRLWSMNSDRTLNQVVRIKI